MLYRFFSFPLVLPSSSDEWIDVDDIDGSPEITDDTIDVAIDLIDNGEENENSGSIDNDDTDLHVKINDESEDDDNLDVQFISLTLDDNNSSDIDHYELLKNVFELMKKTRLAIKFIRNHNITNEYFTKCVAAKADDKKPVVLTLDMVICWSSSFLMLNRLIKYKDIVNSMFLFPNNLIGLIDPQKKRLQELAIQQREWNLLNALQTLSYFFDSTRHNEPIVLALKESLQFWFNYHCKTNLPIRQIETMMVAAFLDPYIYNRLDDDDRKLAKKYIFKKLNNASLNRVSLPSSSISLSSSSTTATTTTTTTVPSKLSALERLAAVCGQLVSSPTTNRRTMTLDEEISRYIQLAKLADNFQQFCATYSEQLPRLTYLVRRVCVIPATSIPSESLFSTASFIHRKQRSSLSSKTLRQLLVLKNSHLIEKLEQSF
ncbi:unnamed protein product [Rotaria sordida]|nr:unnamed protein product [Rotaria sordida]CAF3838136.1 unnamed protein product [Rotaria sordida]